MQQLRTDVGGVTWSMSCEKLFPVVRRIPKVRYVPTAMPDLRRQG